MQTDTTTLPDAIYQAGFAALVSSLQGSGESAALAAILDDMSALMREILRRGIVVAPEEMWRLRRAERTLRRALCGTPPNRSGEEILRGAVGVLARALPLVTSTIQ